jgi:ABC-type transporter Mla maintaining outer membrane lipid asymmetry ATPase subunit MlaF
VSIACRGLVVLGDGGFAVGPLDLVVEAGDVVAVVGKALSGKSLLLRAIAGLMPPGAVRGEVHVDAPVGFVFQRDALDGDETVFDNVVVCARAADRVADRVESGDPVARAQAALAAVGLSGAVHQKPRALSGGMRRRVGIARALVATPRVLLCDDPTAGLDPQTGAEVLALLTAKTPDGKRPALLIATHDIDGVLPRCSRTVVLRTGRPPLVVATSSLALDADLALYAPRPVDESAFGPDSASSPGAAASATGASS